MSLGTILAVAQIASNVFGKKSSGGDVNVNVGGGLSPTQQTAEAKTMLDDLLASSDVQTTALTDRLFQQTRDAARSRGITGSGIELKALGDIQENIAFTQAQANRGLALDVFNAMQRERQLAQQGGQFAANLAAQQSFLNQQNRGSMLGSVGQLGGLLLGQQFGIGGGVSSPTTFTTGSSGLQNIGSNLSSASGLGMNLGSTFF